MSWPTDTCTTTYLDAGTDDPSLARAEIKTAVDAVKAVIAGRGTASGVCDLDASTLVPASRLSSTAITTALGYTPWHSGNDGAGSGLDADKLDTYEASAFLLKAGGAMTGELDLNGYNIDNIKTATYVAEVANTGTTPTIDWTAGQKQKHTVSGNTTFAFTAPDGPCNLALRIIAGGSYTYTFPGTSPGRVYFPSGTTPTWSTTSGKVDILSLYYDGTDYYGSVAGPFK